jgi:cytochrome c peroxidase
LSLGLIAWLPGGVAGAASTVPCNNQGLPNPCFFTPSVDTGNAIGSLKSVEPKPQDTQLAVGGPFIKNQTALVELGKAFYWDTQVGSDGQSCGSCHVSAGADNRLKNVVSPAQHATPTPSTTFSFPPNIGAANATLSVHDFPIHRLSNIDDRNSTVLFDSTNIVGSTGVFYRIFTAVPNLHNQANAVSADSCISVPDPDNFQVGGVNVRQVTARNAPTVFNSAFNNRLFWDARAEEVFNGVDSFGGSNTSAVVYQNVGGTPQPVQVRIAYASGASIAVGPPVNSTEMSCVNRTFPDVGHKMLSALPLGQQIVDPTDDVLGGLSRSRSVAGQTGLSTTYTDLIHQAFQPGWYSSLTSITINGKSYSQTEANFSLFWGLAVKAYLDTLIADNSPVDQFFDGNQAALSPSALRGLNIFQSFGGIAPDPTDPTGTKTIKVTLSTGLPADARCITCHGGPELTNASINGVDQQRLERMMTRHDTCVIYDQGIFNNGTRPATDDPLLNETDPYGNSFAEVVNAKNGILSSIIPGTIESTPPYYGLNVEDDPTVTGPVLGGTTNCENNNISGNAKVPSLRNVELTGPYFHNGGQLTLMQVVDFYNRGGDFDNTGIGANVHSLSLAEQDKRDLVSFLLALTDERVAHEQAPFDHPSICISAGAMGDSTHVATGTPLPGGGSQPTAADQMQCVSAVGAAGVATRLTPFLGANPYSH